jgi:3-dehydroquinate synthase
VHPVHIDAGALARVATIAREVAPAHRYAVISDENVAPLYAPALASGFEGDATLFTIPAGEPHKSRETWALLTDAMISAGLGRDTTVLALGGGVVGDLAGFVAATYMRGVPVVQLPTTLLAMVDASIGGKTGVDTPGGKNLVGAFHPPAAVVIDPETLATLPPEQLRYGAAEILKHGVIADAAYFDEAAAALPTMLGNQERSPDRWLPLIAGSVRIKLGVVGGDERERGARKTLNFGHTIAHAIERSTEYEVPHGVAVAIGMVVESRIAELAGIADAGTADRVEGAVAGAGLPCEPPAWLDASTVLEATRTDKKGRRGAVEYSLPLRIGEMNPINEWSVSIEDEIVREALAC